MRGSAQALLIARILELTGSKAEVLGVAVEVWWIDPDQAAADAFFAP